jgi:hypothetical protein
MISLSRIFESDTTKQMYRVPMIEKTVERKVNPKTNREKNFKRVRYLETSIPPEERTFKNLPRYANKKPKVKFQDWLLIDAQKRETQHVVTSYGKSAADNKWYGWSHRAVYGFTIGDKIKEGDCGFKGKEYTIETEEQAKQAAIDFAEDVS